MTDEDKSKEEEESYHEKYIFEKYIRPQYGIIERTRWRITKMVRLVKDGFKQIISINPLVAIIIVMMGILLITAITRTVIDIYMILFPRVEETVIPRYLYYQGVKS